ncbi:hypothetical protein ACK8HX_02045 [Oryzobacter sp. R7]|uniref:hypothetical protein n=1 Tax=Oryzobacter faecalis TaxID=3388656 RepID=UPI00398C8BD5
MGTIPTYPAFVAGSVLTAAQLNLARDVDTFWALTPRCSVYQAVATSVVHSAAVTTGTVIAFDTELFDIVQSGDTEMHSTSSNTSRLVIRTPGKYEIAGQVQFVTNATGIRVAQIALNAAGVYGAGTLLVQNSQGALSTGSTSCATGVVEAQLVAGDYLELFGAQSSGAALNTSIGRANTWLRCKLVAQ